MEERQIEFARKSGHLSLSSRLLQEVPPQVFQLSSLKTLDLTSNLLHELPTAIGQLRSLEVLTLTWNKLGKLPDSVGELGNLLELRIGFNGLCTVPSSIGQLRKLRTLELNDNNIRTLPSTLQNCLELRTLSLQFNALERLHKGIAKLQKLSTLSLLGNPLTVPPLEVGMEGPQAVIAYLASYTPGNETREGVQTGGPPTEMPSSSTSYPNQRVMETIDDANDEEGSVRASVAPLIEEATSMLSRLRYRQHEELLDQQWQLHREELERLRAMRSLEGGSTSNTNTQEEESNRSRREASPNRNQNQRTPGRQREDTNPSHQRTSPSPVVPPNPVRQETRTRPKQQATRNLGSYRFLSNTRMTTQTPGRDAMPNALQGQGISRTLGQDETLSIIPDENAASLVRREQGTNRVSSSPSTLQTQREEETPLSDEELNLLRGVLGPRNPTLLESLHPIINREVEEGARYNAADFVTDEDFDAIMSKVGMPPKTNLTEEKAVDISKVPKHFLCPITMDIMRDPVVAADGHTYESKAISRWLRTHKNSPMTGSELPSDALTPNYTLRSMIQDLLDS